MEKLERLIRSGRGESDRSLGKESERQRKTKSKDFNAEALRAPRNAGERLRSRTPHAKRRVGYPIGI